MKWSKGIAWWGSGLRLNVSRSPMRSEKGGLLVLHVSDLNPEREIVNVITRAEAAKIGLWFLWRSLFPNGEKSND